MKKKQTSSPVYFAVSAAAILLTIGVIAGSIYTIIKRNEAAKPHFIEVAKGMNLDIPFSDLTSEVNFIPVKYDGTDMGVIAVKDDIGNVSTAFDVCQGCHDKGDGYYKYEDDALVCQACGDIFEPADVGKNSSNECAPYPIHDIARFDNNGMVIISVDALEDGLWLFDNWNKYDD